MDKFLTRKPIRLKKHDYSTAGYYYVTICTYNRKELFGYIEDNRMVLNEYGKTTEKTWKEIPNHYPDVELDEFIVMPSHIHGVIIINNPVGDGHARPVNKDKNNLSVIIGSYKSAVTKRINRLNNNSMQWQRFFYDHIIRNDKSLDEIREYISNNPLKWDDDENNIKNNKLMGQACLTPTE
jgi:REP element-mobilizing transposase RayT